LTVDTLKTRLDPFRWLGMSNNRTLELNHSKRVPFHCEACFINLLQFFALVT